MSTLPIVGARFRPPALALIKGMPQNTQIYLRAEPLNHVDPNAIQVFLKSCDLELLNEEQIEILSEELRSSGKTTEDIFAFEEWHLGYVPANLALNLRINNLVKLETEYPGNFSINFRGAPQIEVDLEGNNV